MRETLETMLWCIRNIVMMAVLSVIMAVVAGTALWVVLRYWQWLGGL